MQFLFSLLLTYCQCFYFPQVLGKTCPCSQSEMISPALNNVTLFPAELRQYCNMPKQCIHNTEWHHLAFKTNLQWVELAAPSDAGLIDNDQ